MSLERTPQHKVCRCSITSVRILFPLGGPRLQKAAGDHITLAATEQRQHPESLSWLWWIPVDQATIVNYALGYIAVAIAVFVMFLPALASLGLLLLAAGTVQLTVLVLQAVAIGLYRAVLRAYHYLLNRWQSRPGGRLTAH